MYNKLFEKILDSSIWLEPSPTRIVWLTFIAVMDERGFVQFAAVGNVANRARVTMEEAQAAIACLESPDAESSDPEHEGRRIERVPGGWIVLNAEKHRALVTRAVKQEQTRLRVQKHREKKRNGNASVTPSEARSEAKSEVQPERTRTKSAREKDAKASITPGPAIDVWLREFTELYPAQGRCASFMTEVAFCAVIMDEGGLGLTPEVQYGLLCARLDSHKRSDQWQRGKIPRLDRYLREGLHLQELPEPQPASAHAGRRLTEPEPASRFDESQISPWVIECRTLQHEPRCQSSATHAFRLVVAETCQHWGVCESLAECAAKGGAR